MEYELLALPKAGRRVVVALSGGVDSVMTALLLKENGCDVSCATMSVWREGDFNFPSEIPQNEGCYNPNEKIKIEENAEFCAKNSIPFFEIDVKDVFKERVIEYLKSEYRSGRTPNPCVMCNKFVKFGALFFGVKKILGDFDFFCTGHYAKIVQPKKDLCEIFGESKIDSRPAMISMASDKSKDQSYFLYGIPSEILEKVRFPLANFSKEKIIKLANEYGLKVAQKKESQDFVPAKVFESFFNDAPSATGNFFSVDGKVLGCHKGIEHYTVGQRHGLGIGGAARPYYVTAIDAKNNAVILGHKENLFSNSIIVEKTIWPVPYEPLHDFEVNVKIRFASSPVKAKVRPLANKKYEVIFSQKQRAACPGQVAVFYHDDVVLGGGIISSAK